MIDFDDLDNSNSKLVERVANLDTVGCPRGECNCCDCPEWLGHGDRPPARFVRTYAYNVFRRWDSMSATVAAGGQMNSPIEYQYCLRCGCHAVWHEDLSEQMLQLQAKGMLVEADPDWSYIERVLFCQTGGVFQSNPHERDEPDEGVGGVHLEQLREEDLANSVWDTTMHGRLQTAYLFHGGCCRMLPEGNHGTWCLRKGVSPQLSLDCSGQTLVCELEGCGGMRGVNVNAENRASVFRRARARGRLSAFSGVNTQESQEHVLISVICPTGCSRQVFHPYLYHCFCHQSHPAKELVVIDTGLHPSAHFVHGAPKDDPRVLYRWFPEEGAPWTIGAKRNLACYLAAGTVICHFDDDDIYCPWYLSTMLKIMLNGESFHDGIEVRIAEEGDSAQKGAEWKPNPNPLLRFEGFAAEAATLSSWYTYDLGMQRFRICDVDHDHEGKRDWVFGYGFTFAYLRDAWRAHPFRDVNLGEDFDFLEGLLARGTRVALLRDRTGLCFHTHHNQNFSMWEEDKEVEEPTGPAGEILSAMGKALKQDVMPGKVTSRASSKKNTAAALTRRTAAAMQNDLIAEYTKTDFQHKLHSTFAATRGDPAKWKSEQRKICLEVQGPVIARYGFENSFEGVLRSTVAFTADINADPYISRKNFFIHWLVDPDKQARDPQPEEKLRQLINDLCKSAKVRKRRE